MRVVHALEGLAIRSVCASVCMCVRVCVCVSAGICKPTTRRQPLECFLQCGVCVCVRLCVCMCVCVLCVLSFVTLCYPQSSLLEVPHAQKPRSVTHFINARLEVPRAHTPCMVVEGHTHTHTRTHTHTHAHTHTHTRAHTHTHTHTALEEAFQRLPPGCRLANPWGDTHTRAHTHTHTRIGGGIPEAAAWF